MREIAIIYLLYIVDNHTVPIHLVYFSLCNAPLQSEITPIDQSHQSTSCSTIYQFIHNDFRCHKQ